MAKLYTKDQIIEELVEHLKSANDSKIALAASLFLDGNFRQVGDGVFERRLHGKQRNAEVRHKR